jgi:hypothetical protein
MCTMLRLARFWAKSLPSVPQTATVTAAGDKVTVTITAVSGAAYYNVYRSNVGNGVSDAKFIGKIKQGSGNPGLHRLR